MGSHNGEYVATSQWPGEAHIRARKTRALTPARNSVRRSQLDGSISLDVDENHDIIIWRRSCCRVIASERQECDFGVMLVS